MTLYRSFASELESMIVSGALRPGERMASVREASRRRGLSEMTVVHAYHLLEARGLLIARERSGYFVARKPPATLPKPALPRSNPRPTPVDKSGFIFSVLESVKRADVVPLGSAFPSPLLFPLQRLSRSLTRAVRELDPWRTVTDLTPGNLELRRLICVRYAMDGIRMSPDDLVITDGAMEALNLALAAVTRPGDAVVIESPTFYVALQALERLGLRAIELPAHPEDGVDLDVLARLLERQRPAACWLMPTFQNPLGTLLSAERKQALVALLARAQVPLIEDDVYGELYYGAHRPRPAKAFDDAGGVLHCSSFSKCLAPGYRIGWVSGGRFTAAIQRLKLGTTLGAALPSQLALADYLAQGAYEQHLRRLRRVLKLQRDHVLSAVREHFPAGTRATCPAGGYFLWVQLPGGVDALALYREALHENISVAPGPIFSPRERFTDCIRINYGHPGDARVLPALRSLGRLAARLRN